MAREKENYRENLERICEHFKGELIAVREAAEFLGIDLRALRSDKTFPIKKVGGRYYVTAVAMAKWLS